MIPLPAHSQRKKGQSCQNHCFFQHLTRRDYFSRRLSVFAQEMKKFCCMLIFLWKVGFVFRKIFQMVYLMKLAFIKRTSLKQKIQRKNTPHSIKSIAKHYMLFYVGYFRYFIGTKKMPKAATNRLNSKSVYIHYCASTSCLFYYSFYLDFRDLKGAHLLIPSVGI